MVRDWPRASPAPLSAQGSGSIGGITSTGAFGSRAYLLSSGTCSIENTMVIGITAPELEAGVELVGTRRIGDRTAAETAPGELVEHRQAAGRTGPSCTVSFSPALGLEFDRPRRTRISAATARTASPPSSVKREQRVDDGRLHLDEGVVLQPAASAAEHQHHDTGDQRHHRHTLLEDQPASAPATAPWRP